MADKPSTGVPRHKVPRRRSLDTSFTPQNRRPRPNFLYHNVDLVVLITSVRSMPRNSDFQEITFYTGHGKEGGRRKKIEDRRIGCSTPPRRRPQPFPTRTLAPRSHICRSGRSALPPPHSDVIDISNTQIYVIHIFI